jgi:hypothetical protein
MRKKGKKKYKSTQGSWYRFRLGYKLRAKIKKRKMLRKLSQAQNLN